MSIFLVSVFVWFGTVGLLFAVKCQSFTSRGGMKSQQYVDTNHKQKHSFNFLRTLMNNLALIIFLSFICLRGTPNFLGY